MKHTSWESWAKEAVKEGYSGEFHVSFKDGGIRRAYVPNTTGPAHNVSPPQIIMKLLPEYRYSGYAVIDFKNGSIDKITFKEKL